SPEMNRQISHWKSVAQARIALLLTMSRGVHPLQITPSLLSSAAPLLSGCVHAEKNTRVLSPVTFKSAAPVRAIRFNLPRHRSLLPGYAGPLRTDSLVAQKGLNDLHDLLPF